MEMRRQEIKVASIFLTTIGGLRSFRRDLNRVKAVFNQEEKLYLPLQVILQNPGNTVDAPTIAAISNNFLELARVQLQVRCIKISSVQSKTSGLQRTPPDLFGINLVRGGKIETNKMESLRSNCICVQLGDHSSFLQWRCFRSRAAGHKRGLCRCEFVAVHDSRRPNADIRAIRSSRRFAETQIGRGRNSRRAITQINFLSRACHESKSANFRTEI